jgi:hypothetical protein
MKLLDDRGRLFGRVSLIDIILLVTALGLGLGYVYQRTSQEINQIVNADTAIYVTLAANQMREFSVNAVEVGDVMYRQHDRQPLGTVVRVEAEPATEYLLRPDGTAERVPMEDRYRTFITLECTGSVTEAGYYVNGNLHIAPGIEMVLVSNRVIIPESQVQAVSETAP